ncbi:hydroxyquinol 1,2-dioxygenase [Altererythrobacter salegens]|uniref:Hydroxyquinol 1,2-dioxygenase n=1 Tax=Croceibacterium salegens TaxID=1737568 RepID=A0A6I4SSY5_9SPHN|nr:dioxygenase [Croceibacterium salegens]MXO58448.1 hydroxyquinol 1,2-dioxygenase [Croceibacterium salegens]
MNAVTPEQITRSALASFAGAPDGRTRELSNALIRHLHAFVTEVDPTPAEWMGAIEFLTRVGHTCQGARQEFILLSDVLGVSMLVDTLQQTEEDGVTESTVLGPFYVEEPPIAEQGSRITDSDDGIPLWVDIEVTDSAGKPLEGAIVDIWEGGPDGLYDVQRDLPEGEYDLRGRFRTDADGRVRCWAVVPVSYQVPADGPVGDLLAKTGRHPWRPGHVHFKLAADGFVPLVTHLFPSGDPYLTSDAVFGVKPSLIIELDEHDPGEGPAGREMNAPWKSLHYTFALSRE